MPAPNRRFLTTRWTLIRRAKGVGAEARRALEELCAAYWYPLYAFARRSGSAPEAAADQVQDFFGAFLRRQAWSAADPHRGRFRSFLLACFKNHAADLRERAGAKKRGGGQRQRPLAPSDPEARYAREPAHDETPERLYDRAWALAVLDEAMGRLRQRYRASGQEELFEGLKGTLSGEKRPGGLKERGERLGLSEGAVKVAAHRLRQRYGEALRAIIAETIDGSEEAVEDEIRALFRAFEAP